MKPKKQLKASLAYLCDDEMFYPDKRKGYAKCVPYALIPCATAKQARALAKFFNLSEQEQVERLAVIIRERNPCIRFSANEQARACLSTLTGQSK